MTTYVAPTAAGSANIEVDGQNVFHARDRLGPIDVIALLRTLRATYGPGPTTWHQAHPNSRNPFFDLLRRNGVRVNSRAPKHTDRGWDWNMDADIATSGTLQLDEHPTLVLVSGDGDFASLLAAATQRGRRRVVVAASHMLSPLLLEHLDNPGVDYIDLARFANPPTPHLKEAA